MIPYNQLSLADIFSDCQKIYESDKPQFLFLLQQHIDLDEIVPASFRNDFFNLDEGRFGKGIINNSKTKIILNLEDDEAMRVQSALHLSDAEIMEVTHFERGNGLISTNNNNIMVEFKASPLEKDLITTDRRELKDIVERMRRQNEAG